MAKRGPRGAWEVRDKTCDKPFKIFEENASVDSTKISDTLLERTGVRF